MFANKMLVGMILIGCLASAYVYCTVLVLEL